MANKKLARIRRMRSNEAYRQKEQELIANLSEAEQAEITLYKNRLFSKVDHIEGEIWVDLIGWESDYLISNYSRIKSKARDWCKTPHLHHSGYYTVDLHKSTKAKYFILSRLTALHFIPNPNNLLEINHKNKIRTDNRLTNLEWSSPKENTKHKFGGLGSPNKRAVIQMSTSMEEIKTWDSITAAATVLGFSVGNIVTAIQQGRVRYGFIWKYKNAS